jgi:hypothetical protein
MRRSRAFRWVCAAAVGLAALAAGGLAQAPSFAADSAQIYLVQGLPGKTVTVTVDGRQLAAQLKSGVVVGPFTVRSGSRVVKITAGASTLINQVVAVRPGENADVVAHLPARPDGKPLLTTYRNDLTAVPRDKASLTVAHTAAVPPADIRVNDTVLFSDVGNGESLHVVVPVATYKVAIVPTGRTSPVYFGPVDLTLRGGSLNAVYAIGDPAARTMNVVVHVLTTAGAGSARPGTVDTGTGGQAVGAGPTTVVDLTR